MGAKERESPPLSSREDRRTLGTCYTKNSSFVCRTYEEEVILVPIGQDVGNLESIYTLNRTSAFLWEKIDGRNRVGDILESLVEEFDVNPQKAQQDISKLFAQLEEIGAISQTPIREEVIDYEKNL